MTRRTSTAYSNADSLRRRLLRDWDEPYLERRVEAPAPPPAPALPIYLWLGISPPTPEATGRRCSRGCHVLAASARFDPHTGAPLDPRAAAPRIALLGV